MWDRKELKARGKVAMKANYWRCVVAGMVVALTSGAGSMLSSSRVSGGTNNEELQSTLSNMSEEELVTVAAVILGVVGLIMVVSFVLNVFVFSPLEVGGRRFFVVNSEEPAQLGELGFSFRNGYLHVALAMLRRNVQLLLWSMLFFIPGIVKGYSYRMVPYILAENPDMSGGEAIALSRRMMNGQKWNAFVLDLSFLGWAILTALTLGLVGILYMNPYKAATDAELYRTLREGV